MGDRRGDVRVAEAACSAARWVGHWVWVQPLSGVGGSVKVPVQRGWTVGRVAVAALLRFGLTVEQAEVEVNQGAVVLQRAGARWLYSDDVLEKVMELEDGMEFYLIGRIRGGSREEGSSSAVDAARRGRVGKRARERGGEGAAERGGGELES